MVQKVIISAKGYALQGALRTPKTPKTRQPSAPQTPHRASVKVDLMGAFILTMYCNKLHFISGHSDQIFLVVLEYLITPGSTRLVIKYLYIFSREATYTSTEASLFFVGHVNKC